MLVEAVRHLLEAEPNVLEADLLRHGYERHRREVPVHTAHQAREHGCVAHARIEDPQRGRDWLEVPKLLRDAPRDHRLLVARVDEREVLLAIVEEPERRRISGLLLPFGPGARSGGHLVLPSWRSFS